MKTIISHVVSQGDVTYIPSSKQEGGQLAKCIIRLKEFGGGKFGNEYACTMFGSGIAAIPGTRGELKPVSGGCC